MSDKKIAIVDCNNFYVSCERLFNPKIKFKPTIVMSNNDGCVIARSQEVKDMGIKMGQHLFNMDDSIKQSITKFSSNYVLYGDISDRITHTLRRYTSLIEVYSIDESFLDLTHVADENLDCFLREIRSEVLRLTGIPVSIGVGPNKTLAKLMNQRSKKEPLLGGICIFDPNQGIDDVPIKDVWGIGSKWAEKLASINVGTVGEFKAMHTYTVGKMFTIVGLRTWFELHCKLIFPIQLKFKRPKVVTTSRTFGNKIWQQPQIKDAVCSFLQDGCDKLKVEGLKPKTCIVFLTTDRFQQNFQVWSKKIHFFTPSNTPQEIWNEISPHLNSLPGRTWARAGIVFFNLIDENVILNSLFEEIHEFSPMSDLKVKAWMTRRDFLSPNWTTDWKDIPKLV